MRRASYRDSPSLLRRRHVVWLMLWLMMQMICDRLFMVQLNIASHLKVRRSSRDINRW